MFVEEVRVVGNRCSCVIIVLIAFAQGILVIIPSGIFIHPYQDNLFYSALLKYNVYLRGKRKAYYVVSRINLNIISERSKNFINNYD